MKEEVLIEFNIHPEQLKTRLRRSENKLMLEHWSTVDGTWNSPEDSTPCIFDTDGSGFADALRAIAGEISCIADISDDYFMP
jgi:hypothetical protein